MTGKKASVKPNIPKSVTRGWICFTGLICYMISLYFIRIFNINNSLGAIVAGLAFVIPIILLEYLVLKTYNKASTGLNFKVKNKLSVERVLIKLIGLYATLGLVVLLYWLFPEYHSGGYDNYFVLAKYLLLIIVFVSIPYFSILDMYLVEPKEEYWKVGMIVMGKWKEINFEGLKNFFLGWLVKAFFLPLMYNGLVGNIGFIKEHPFTTVYDFSSFYNYMVNYIYTIDLAVVTVGYLMTLRIFDSHIRTVEPSFLGWYVALQCYQPFWGALQGNYFNYQEMSWDIWIAPHQILYVVWGSLILVLIAVYSWASVYFGVRFSNLTNRGILTNGPYRFMRHPAYVSKNLSWWLVSVPFISIESPYAAIKHCLLLLLVNFIYFMRAKTEERHLSQDPTYVQYATAMNERGIFKGLFKIFPFLKYDASKYQKVIQDKT